MSAPRLTRVLLVLYVFVAFADAAGKTLAATPSVNRVLSHLVGSGHAGDLRQAARPSGNFEIFRLSTRHLVSGENLYARYPEELSDQYKYSPTFPVLFAPFAFVWWPVALFLWSLLNALMLFYAVQRVLPIRQAQLAQAFLLLEVLRAMQNAQSNALVAALVILAFAELEPRRAARSAAAVVIGACIKIFPLAALSFAIPRRAVARVAAWTVVWTLVLGALPLLVTSPARLVMQYRWWHEIESSDALQRWFSVMELLHRFGGVNWPNWPVQAAGTLALLAPVALRRNRWNDARFRFLYLCSVLMYVVLFNHQAERASYLIAFTGATIWFCSEPPARWRRVLYGIGVVTIPLMSTVIPGAIFRTELSTLCRLTLPCLLIWLAVQRDLWRLPLTASPPELPLRTPATP